MEMEMAIVEDEEPEVNTVGEEDLNEEATAYIDRILRDDETPIAVAGFDFETKVLVITDQRILITGEEDGIGMLVLSVTHDDIYPMRRDGRTLIIGTRTGEEHRYRFGKDQTVEELVEIAGNQQTTQAQMENEGKLSIEERVRFWEEQDKINQELIPRVIRQNELLTEHIAEHDSLPEVAGAAISQALAGAREEQRQQYEAALDAAKRELTENARASLDQALAAVRQALAGAREEQRQQYEAALDAAKRELTENARASLDQALAAVRQALAGAREEQRQQYEAALDAAKRELAENARASLDQALAATCGSNPEGRATCSSS